MWNLSQGIKEKGIAIGKTRIICRMYKNGFTLEQIAIVSEKSVAEVQAIIEKGEPALT